VVYTVERLNAEIPAIDPVENIAKITTQQL
jgi:hypothetical protein